MKRSRNYINNISKKSISRFLVYLKRRSYLKNYKSSILQQKYLKSIVWSSFFSRRDFFFKIFLSKYVISTLYTLKENNLREKYLLNPQTILTKIKSSVDLNKSNYNLNYTVFYSTFSTVFNIYKLLILLVLKIICF